ncbi:MAG: DNA translocase FtsK, partial [Bacilli bacterium]|nr:DNA translocase FtsK [Bacilli bacterium]
DPTPAMPSTSPREVSSPSPSSYSQNPVRQAGLQEAFFVPSGEPRPERPSFKQEAPQEEPKQVAPSPVPAEPAPLFPASPRIAVATESRPEPQEEVMEEPAPSYAPKIDALPVQSEPSYERQVDTSSLLHEVKPADTITLADSEEEEEAYEPPKNDPIVLTPDPTVILTPETVNPIPEPETKEEAPQSDDPIPDYDPPKAPETHNFEDENEGPLPRYVFPDASLLDEGKGESDKEAILAECAEKARLIDQIFADFGVGAHVTEYLVGPSITRYSIAADPGVSVSTISRYIQDLEVRLGGVPVRFVERVLGLACSALEVANTTRRIVPFKEVFVGLPKRKDSADLHIPFGIDIAGTLKEADLGKFPHMLVAGTSGSGKSIFAHGILMSLVMRNRPEDLKLVLIDPKRGVEMAPYKDMPHLLCPIVKEAHPAKNALKKLCDVMDERYEVFARTEVRDIGSYNRDYAIPNGKKRMPYIVVFVDEFADLVGECKEISEYVLRIAQKARACGIHLIVATQRPDVKVITGTIKSNLLCRVALTVASSTDSQTILGVGGAEDLYGYGDMLIDCQELSKRDFVRAQGCLATTHEMKAVCDFVRAQMKPHYDPNFLNLEDEEEESGPEIRDGGYAPAAPSVSSQELRKMADEEKYQYVKSVIMTREYCSISMIQREFEVGFPRAGKILARLQNEGVVAAAETSNNSRGCRVLIHEDPSGDGGIA